jgi:hypothetical protein
MNRSFVTFSGASQHVIGLLFTNDFFLKLANLELYLISANKIGLPPFRTVLFLFLYQSPFRTKIK